jgi:general secretion pathway protein G
MRRPNASRRAQRGFTLVEVLVVLAILVMLVGMVVPRILGTQKKADISGAKTQLGMFSAALEKYALDVKSFPTTEQGMAALLQKPADLDEAVKWDGPYLNAQEMPKDPWGHDYKYEYPPTHGKLDRPDIWSAGPDGQDETEDDVVSWSKSAATGEQQQGATSEEPAPKSGDSTN